MPNTQDEPIQRPAAVPAIWSSIIAVMDEVTNVPKTGEMKNRKGETQYHFVPSSELRARIGRSFRNHALMLQSRDITASFEAKPVSGANGSTVWTTAQVTLTYVFTSLVDGSTVEFEAAGEGRDSSDKATAKAMTMALKSALSQAFMLATDDEDPDATRPEVVQEDRYAPPPPDNRTDAQRAAQEAYERRKAQLAQDTRPEQATRLTTRQPSETDEQYLARLRAEQAPQEDYNAAVRQANQNGRPAQVHPARPTQAAEPAGDPMADAERMLTDRLGARPVDEIGQKLVTAISEATRTRMAGGKLTPKDTQQRQRAGAAVTAAVNATDLAKLDRIILQAEAEGLLQLVIDEDKMVAAMLKAMRDSRLAGAST
jgi:hypothetical protein